MKIVNYYLLHMKHAEVQPAKNNNTHRKLKLPFTPKNNL